MERLCNTGLVIPDRVPWGTHLCHFYETANDLLDVLVPYFQAGLEANEACLWIISDPISIEEATNALRAAVPDLDGYLTTGQMEIVPHDAWYLVGGSFKIDAVLDAWRKKTQSVLNSGYCGLRASGNAAHFQEDHWADWAAYEGRVHPSLHGQNILALCSYSLHKCSASQLFQTVDLHDCAFVRRQGGWQCIDSKGSKLLFERLSSHKHALASSISPTVMTDMETRITYANPAALKAWGYETEAEVLGRHAADFLQDLEALLSHLDRVRESGSSVAELVAKRKDGSPFDVEILGSMTFDDRGQPIGIVASCLDITQRKREQEGLRKANFCIEQAGDYIFWTEPDGHISYINPKGREALGFSAEALRGMTVFDVDPTVTPDKWKLHWNRLQRDKSFMLESVLRTKAGELVPIEVSVNYMSFDGKECNCAFARDISERKAAEKQLAHFSAIVSSSQDAIIGSSLDGFVTSWNPGAKQLYGYTAYEMIGEPISQLFLSDRADEVAALLARLQQGGLVEHFDSVGRRKDGSLMDVSVTLSPIKDHEGKIIGASAIVRDIADRKHSEAMLKDTCERAEAASRAKSEFLANMSHEIRTPMTAILGFSDILLASAHDEETVEACQIIKRNGDHLLQVINDILDLSKIEAGRQELDFQPCSLRQLVAEVITTMQVRADAKGLPLSAKFQENLSDRILTAPIRLRQILVNLIGNAIKFTETGGVRIVVSQDASGEDATLRFDIIDTGIGIGEDELPLLFQPFYQADGSARRQFGGTGLGLAISKRLAQMLGGDITVSSVLGKGTTFTATITARPVIDSGLQEQNAGGEGRRMEADSTHALNCRILLAEDGPDNQRLIAFVLRKAGADVTIVENGQKAVEHAFGHRTSEPFDVILMDMQMPVMDGYEATRTLRERGCRGPIVALTAHAMKEDRQRCLDAGCDDYLSKPIDRATLLQAVHRYAPMDQVSEALD